jgi:pantothenate kinase
LEVFLIFSNLYIDETAKKINYFVDGKFDFKLYRDTNKEQINERMNKYRETNKELINEKSKAHYHANKEEINARRRAKYAEAKSLLYNS